MEKLGEVTTFRLLLEKSGERQAGREDPYE